ncbi:MAG: hypothetical protein HDT43_10325 [Ruminococcaceae bacterium]|nr:hypothetical protein [Oscillospiraceae bacterium]
MTKNKKILIITLSAVGRMILVLITAAVIDIYCSVTNQPAELIETLSAKGKAVAYVKEKYGGIPLALSAEPVYSGGFMFGKGTLRGSVVHFSGFDVLVADDKITDNRQYAEIVDAFTEKFLPINEIYSEVEEQTVALDFGVRVSSKTYQEFNSAYFDGDISEFLRAADPGLIVCLEGQGFHEKRDETPALLYEMLERIYNSTGGDIRVYAYVYDPELDLPDMPLEDNGYRALRYPPKRYDDYMELIAAGSIDRHDWYDEIIVQQPIFYNIDEFTAISDYDVASRITSEKDFFFAPKDFSENTTVYRGIYNLDYRADENVLTVKENGIYCGLNNTKHDFLLRLDRERYGITDSTIALRVTPPVTAERWYGKQLYVSDG